MYKMCLFIYVCNFFACLCVCVCMYTCIILCVCILVCIYVKVRYGKDVQKTEVDKNTINPTWMGSNAWDFRYRLPFDHIEFDGECVSDFVSA